MANYEIDITMSTTTVDELKNEGYALYAFKAVQTASKGGAPLVWFKTTSFLTSTSVTWEEEYQAYISTDEIVANGVVTATTYCEIDLAQTANVTQNGNISGSAGGTANAISLFNQGNAPWTAGISQLSGGVANPMCAIPLHGNGLDVIAPIEKVLLMFTSNTVNTGTVVYKSYSQGALIDLTTGQQRAVSFDIDNGWSWGTSTWAKAVPANESLVPLLITS